MSCQRGNAERNRPQKHQNKRVFKNDLHDTNIRTKRINQIRIVDVCSKCKAILDWKIKYKKYKVLKSPKSCNKCHEKKIKQPYHTVCEPCALRLRICPKCEVPRNNADESSEKIPDKLEVNDSALSGLEFNDGDYVAVNLNDEIAECSKNMSDISLAELLLTFLFKFDDTNGSVCEGEGPMYGMFYEDDCSLIFTNRSPPYLEG